MKVVRLGFHYHVPAVRRSDGIYMPGYLGRFVDALAVHCERIVLFLHTPLPDEMPLMDYRIQSSSVDLVEIGPHEPVPKRVIRALSLVVPRVRKWRDKLDVMLIRGPSPLLPLVAWAAKPLPTALLIVGDYLAGVEDLPQPLWRKALIRLWAYWNRWGQDHVAKRSLTFVNSHKLYEDLSSFVPNLIETRTTTLTEKDFFVRDDTCLNPPYRLLYVGRIATEKGILDILEALALLVEQGENIVFDLVGWFQKNDITLEELRKRAIILNLTERVHYHGYKPVGPDLFAFYRQSDIFVIASRSSFEGFPRVIWEAMAHSLPVVATKVGSIPVFLQGAAELVEPCNPWALADGISSLLHDPERRQRYIKIGRELARQNTLESQTEYLIRELKKWLKNLCHCEIYYE